MISLSNGVGRRPEMDIIITAWMFDYQWSARYYRSNYQSETEMRVVAEEMISALMASKFRFEVHFETAVMPLAA